DGDRLAAQAPARPEADPCMPFLRRPGARSVAPCRRDRRRGDGRLAAGLLAQLALSVPPVSAGLVVCDRPGAGRVYRPPAGSGAGRRRGSAAPRGDRLGTLLPLAALSDRRCRAAAAAP